MHKRSSYILRQGFKYKESKRRSHRIRFSELEITRSNYSTIIPLSENDFLKSDLLKYVGLRSLSNASKLWEQDKKIQHT